MPEFINSLLKEKSFKTLDDIIYELAQSDIVLDAKIDLFTLTVDYVSKLPKRKQVLEILNKRLSLKQREILNKYLK